MLENLPINYNYNYQLFLGAFLSCVNFQEDRSSSCIQALLLECLGDYMHNWHHVSSMTILMLLTLLVL